MMIVALSIRISPPVEFTVRLFPARVVVFLRVSVVCSPDTMWFEAIAVRLGVPGRALSPSGEGSFVNAPSVGAKTVYGPCLSRTRSTPVVWRRSMKVVNLP